jgi:hypothetical protein
MRCFICDWSPTCDSLYHESLALTGFVDDTRNSGLAQMNGRPTNADYNNNSISIDKQGREICSHCNRSASVQSSILSTFPIKDHEVDDLIKEYESKIANQTPFGIDLEQVSNDNEPIDVEFEEIA